MSRFRKKPVVIDAVQWDGTPGIIDWILAGGGSVRYCEKVSSEIVPFLLIDTLEGSMSADVGDWIIRGIAGEFYPCKPDIFEATYEEVE